jgi:proteasome accessory factor B
MGVFWAPPERIAVEFDAAVAPFVRGRVWHDSQQMIEQPDGRLHMILDVSNDWALRSWLLGFGASVRVLEPAGLAETIASELARALQQYQPATGGAWGDRTQR